MWYLSRLNKTPSNDWTVSSVVWSSTLCWNLIQISILCKVFVHRLLFDSFSTSLLGCLQARFPDPSFSRAFDLQSSCGFVSPSILSVPHMCGWYFRENLFARGCNTQRTSNVNPLILNWITKNDYDTLARGSKRGFPVRLCRLSSRKCLLFFVSNDVTMYDMRFRDILCTF